MLQSPGRPGTGMVLSWHGVSYTMNSKTVLNSVSGSIVPSGITALVGPNHAGKSCLLEVLAGDTSYSARTKGEVRVNQFVFQTNQYDDLKASVSRISERSQAFLAKDNSPREIISFHVRLRLPKTNVKERTDFIIQILGLSPCANSPSEKLTKGERIRTLIGIELVRTPAALFLDEPLEGLDVFDAYKIFQVLRGLKGVSVFFTATRLASEVFYALDRVLIMSRGSIVYEGTPQNLSDHFAQAGHPCPSQHAPADFAVLMLQTIDWNEHTRLVENWRWSFGNGQGSLDTAPAIQSSDPSLLAGKTVSLKESFPDLAATLAASPTLRRDSKILEKPIPFKRPPTSVQFRALLSREVTRIMRDPNSLLLRLFTTAVISLLVACFAYKLGTRDVLNNTTDLQNYAGAISFVLLASSFGEVESVAAAIPSTRARFLVEYNNNLYGSLVFFIVQIIIEVPQALIANLVLLCLSFWTIGLRGNFFYWLLNLFAVTVSTNSVGWLISTTTSSTLTAMQFMPLVFLPQILFSGFLIDVALVPSSVRWLNYFCYLKYVSDLVFINEFGDDITAGNTIVGQHATSNKIITQDKNLYTLVVIVFIIGLRFIASVALARQAKARG